MNNLNIWSSKPMKTTKFFPEGPKFGTFWGANGCNVWGDKKMCALGEQILSWISDDMEIYWTAPRDSTELQCNTTKSGQDPVACIKIYSGSGERPAYDQGNGTNKLWNKSHSCWRMIKCDLWCVRLGLCHVMSHLLHHAHVTFETWPLDIFRL